MTCDVRGICNALTTEPCSEEMTTAILRGTGGEFQEEWVTSILKKLFFLHDFCNCTILITSILKFCQFFCGVKQIDVCRDRCVT